MSLFLIPGLSWGAMLKMTDIKLELIIDIDMFQFIEMGICVVEYIIQPIVMVRQTINT